MQLTVPDDKKTAVEQAAASVKKAAADGADLVALGEMFCCPYQTDKFPVYAEPRGGAVWSACARMAKENGVYLSAGSMPELDGDKVYNTAYVFDRNGNQIAAHRKMHLFDIAVQGGQSFKESDTLSAGNEVTTFSTEFGTMGLCVCYDFRFPELGRLMALKGACAVLVPAAFNMTTGPAHWSLTFCAQALFNQFYVFGTAPARDMSASYHSWGHSIAVDPWGQEMGELGENAGTLKTTVEMSRVLSVRSQLPLLKHRRTDVYDLRQLNCKDNR